MSGTCISRDANIHCRSAILDGEVIVRDRRGASDFEALQAALKSKRTPLLFYAFDLLHLDRKDYRNVPLMERRTKLKHLVGSSPSAIQFSEELVGDAEAFFRACRKHQLEGMVSKLANSSYRSGRSRTWLKTKCFTESDFILPLTLRITFRLPLDGAMALASREAKAITRCQ